MPDDEKNPRLTLAFVRRVRAPGRYYDRGGLILTVSPGGGKSWSQRITIDGRRRDMGLGSAHVVTPAEARRMAARNKAMVRAGKNPFVPEAEPRRDEPEKSKKEVTFAAFNAHRFRRLRSIPGKEEASREAYGRIRLHANPVIGRVMIREVSPEDLVRTLKLVSDTSRETGRWLRTQLVRIFDDAIEEGHTSENPARAAAVQDLDALIPVRVSKHAEGRRILRRLPAFIEQIEADNRRPASFILIRFCLLSARNVKECRLARWSQMDIAASRWTFPAMQRDDREDVTLQLTPSLLDLLDRARNFAHGEMDGYVFPSRQGIAEPFISASLSMSLKRAGYDLVPLDFRRAYDAWFADEGGGSLEDWERRLRT